MLRAHRAVLVCGETGCGKSTQIPHFLLEARPLPSRAAPSACRAARAPHGRRHGRWAGRPLSRRAPRSAQPQRSPSSLAPPPLPQEACRAGRGGECSVVVTQPRRIAAISLAERVAAERGGSQAGGTVGYAVRLERKCGPRTKLLFCSTGVLLRRCASRTPPRTPPRGLRIVSTQRPLRPDKFPEASASLARTSR